MPKIIHQNIEQLGYDPNQDGEIDDVKTKVTHPNKVIR